MALLLAEIGLETPVRMNPPGERGTNLAGRRSARMIHWMRTMATIMCKGSTHVQDIQIKYRKTLLVDGEDLVLLDPARDSAGDRIHAGFRITSADPSDPALIRTHHRNVDNAIPVWSHDEACDKTGKLARSPSMMIRLLTPLTRHPGAAWGHGQNDEVPTRSIKQVQC